ncbi:MAG: recombinase family protein [Candidatus Shapirobacteria bacterium]|nr:recombinase family protein [Candidatus Shapirobacteria bacterium]
MNKKESGKIRENEQVKYCLYARKSTESDERQAMSIDSQIKEMTDLANRDGLIIKEVRQESHSAKSSGLRPVFNQLLIDIRNGVFNAILTWAPDRLSRNAGDLGTLVDLMDQGKLATIRTFSQSFSNNPNEKFLLMILCSQAKLENDNRGINVKRGLRAKCEAGWRPNKAPLGYLNVMNNNRISYVVIDKERAPIVKQMFTRVAEKGQSGRVIKAWLDQIDFRTQSGCKLAISKVYEALKKPFYYGEFEFGGKTYKGNHEPIITKELFDKVQRRLLVPPKEWHKKLFPFRQICKCGTCGASITAEDKYKKLKYGGFKKHIYYHCTRSIDYDCEEPYITEDDLIQQLIAQIDKVKIDESFLTKQLKEEIEKFHSLRDQVLHQEFLTGNLNQFDYPQKDPLDVDMAKDYLLHVLKAGSSEDRVKILSAIKTKFILHNKQISIM